MQSAAAKQSLYGIDPGAFPWLWEAFALILVTLVARYFLWLLLRKLGVQLQKTGKRGDVALVVAADKPTGFFVWRRGGSLFLAFLSDKSDAVIC